MDYLDFTNWKNYHVIEMQDLTFAMPNDIFIFTRFTVNNPFKFGSKQVLYAENIEEVIGYLRHIFIYDILNDAIDDLEFDFKFPFSERQSDVIEILNFWHKLGKIQKDNYKELEEFCKNFNATFNVRNDVEYEIQILNGADKLRKFLTEKYSQCENFDKRRICDICSKQLFSGQALKEFIDKLY